MVKDGETGLLIHPDGSALKEALQRLIADPSLRRHLGQTARQWVLERFGLERMVNSTEAALKAAG